MLLGSVPCSSPASMRRYGPQRIISIYTKIYGVNDGRVGMAMCSLAHALCVKGSVNGIQVIKDSNYMMLGDDVLQKIRIDLEELLHMTGKLANNGLPLEIQKLRCRVNYSGLRFTSQIEELGRRVINLLRKNGPFLVLHLRYEMDILAFSGCRQGCTNEEADELTRMRYAYPWWKEKIINFDLKRKDGLCPLTPEETALVLRPLDIDRRITVYIAAGEIYGGARRMASLTSAFSNVVRKETLLGPSDLKFFDNHSSQMAALDYLVSLESDIFVPTYDGNLAKLVEGHRRVCSGTASGKRFSGTNPLGDLKVCCQGTLAMSGHLLSSTFQKSLVILLHLELKTL